MVIYCKYIENKNRKGSAQKRKQNPPKNGGAARVRALEQKVATLANRGPVHQTRSLPRFKKMSPTGSLHPAEHHLIQAMLRPTDKSRPRHGLFTMPHDDSQKGRGFAEIDITIGTAGVGFITMNPCSVNDGYSCYYSENTFTGIVSASTGTGVTGLRMANLPFVSTSLSAVQPTLYARIVSAGLHATYTGLNQNRGGMVYAFADPAHGNIMGNALGTLTARKQCSITTVKENSVFHMSVNPYTEGELAYGVSSFPYAPNQTSIATMMFVGTPGNTFHVSVVIDVEYIGTVTEGASFPNPLVPAGIARNVINAVTKAKELHATYPDATPTHLVAHAQGFMTAVTEGTRKTAGSLRKVKNSLNTARSVLKVGSGLMEDFGHLAIM